MGRGSTRTEVDVVYGARVYEDRRAVEYGAGVGMPGVVLEPWDRARLERGNFIDMNVIAHRRELPEARFDEGLTSANDWDLILRLTQQKGALELPVLACTYSTSAPHRLSDLPDALAGVIVVRDRHQPRHPH